MYVRNRHSPGLGYAGNPSRARFGQWEQDEAKAADLERRAAATMNTTEKNNLLRDAGAARAAASKSRREHEERIAESRSREALVGTVATVGTQFTAQMLQQQADLKKAKLDAKARVAEAGRPQIVQQGGGGGEGLGTGAIIGIAVGGIAVLGLVLVLATKK